jgi:hypothetical protein
MEILRNRYGSERVLEKIDSNRIRIIGESLMSRTSEDENGNYTMYDFEGGPCLNLGGTITYGKTKWKITKITPEKTGRENLASVTVEVEY